MPGTVLRNERRPVHARMLIGGEWTNSSQRIDVFNPARPDELVGTIPRGAPDDVERAIRAVKAAQPIWASKSYGERAQILAPLLERLAGDIDERAILFVRENGKTTPEARGELAGVPARQRLTLELAAELDRRNELDAPNGRSWVGYLPYGVVVSIVPWNAPVGLAFLQIIPALLAGNTIVLKPPETCPLSLIHAIEMIAPLLPPGVINVVTGMPAEIGDTLTTHPDVDKVAFTGSVPSARKIMANAAQTIKGITLELGGNDAAILLEDADLGDASMKRMATAVYRMTGQVCMAVKRIYAPESIRDQFLDAFTRAVDKIVVGDGLDPAVTMGPMHTARALDRAQSLVADAARRGANVQVLGQIPDQEAFRRGHFMQPTVVSDIAEDAPLMAEEQFCPAVPVASYRDVDDAIARANSTIYGFGGSIWSRDIDRASGLARRLHAGAVFVNTHGTESVNRKLPYGGIKQSGIGRRAGIEGIREYMQVQTLTTFEQ
jgi:acyl-CoA reductase-like NAD-dependent aldehyde dehydrogenase